jgi:hypothetical protein
MNITNLALLVYTNQTYLPIAKLSIEEFNRMTPDLKIKKYLVSNNFDNSINFDNLDITTFNSQIPFSTNSRHFSEVLKYSLERIDEKYILLWVEDTIIATEMKSQNLQSLINIMDDNSIHHMSLMSYGHNWKVLDIDYSKYGLPQNQILEMPHTYMYTFSVQPCIWNRESLLEILNYNNGISIHEFDTTNIRNKKGDRINGYKDGYIVVSDKFWDYNTKHICLNRTYETASYCFDDRPFEGDYFLFLYSGIIRNGKFDFNTHRNSRDFTQKFIKDRGITMDNELYKIFF